MKVAAVYAPPFNDLTRLEKETVALEGGTLADLVAAIAARHGAPFRETFLDPQSGEIVPGMVALLNGRRVGLSAALADGDEVAFLMAMAGGR